MAETPKPSGAPAPVQSSSSFTSFQKAIVAILISAILIATAFYAYSLFKKEIPSMTEKSTAIGTTAPSGVTATSTAPVGMGNGEMADLTPIPEVTAPAEEGTPAVKEADLYVKNYYFSEDPKVGNEFTVKIEIGNKGNLEARNFNWEWWPTSSGRACKEEVDVIPAWGAKVVECDYTYDSSASYTTKAIVDSSSDIQESNENNNVATRTVEPIEKPDLYVSALSFNHEPWMGAEFTVSITIKNKGGDTSDHSHWEWWAASAVKACDGEIGGLDDGESKTVTCDYTYGGWAKYTTKAIVDSNNDISESNERNNTYTKEVTPRHMIVLP